MKQPSTSDATIPPPPPSPDGSIDWATLDLLAVWRQQDATSDPDQIRAAEEDLAEFKKGMNESRTAAGERVLFP